MTMFNPLEVQKQENDSEIVQKLRNRQAKFAEYLQCLEVMGRIRRTRGHYGYSRNVSERTFKEFLKDVPQIDEEHDDIYRSTYPNEDGETRYLLVIGHKANPDEATRVLISAGVESPDEIKARIERKSYFD